MFFFLIVVGAYLTYLLLKKTIILYKIYFDYIGLGAISRASKI